MSEYLIHMQDGTELYHFGVPNMHWKQRKYQNEDGSLTPLGRQHYGVGEPRKDGQDNSASKAASKMGAKTDGKSSSTKVSGTKSGSSSKSTTSVKSKVSSIDADKVKKGLKIAAKVAIGVGVTALAVNVGKQVLYNLGLQAQAAEKEMKAQETMFRNSKEGKKVTRAEQRVAKSKNAKQYQRRAQKLARTVDKQSTRYAIKQQRNYQSILDRSTSANDAVDRLIADRNRRLGIKNK